MLTATTGIWNAAYGRNALRLQTTGNYNTAIGADSLYSNTTASNNTAVGYQAGYSNTTGVSLTAVGKGALYASTGNNNTAVGTSAGVAVTTGAQNTLIGSSAGSALTTGSFNTFIGVNSVGNGGSGELVTTGSKNTILGGYNGNQGGLDIRTASGYVVLSDGDGKPLLSTVSTASVALEGATPTTGTGITFPATQSAAANANTLDDYEEGTWTPTAVCTGQTITYTDRAGYYTKIGNTVRFQAVMIINTVSGAAAGNTTITGLPFANGNPTYSGQFAIGYNDGFANTLYGGWISVTDMLFRNGARGSGNDGGGFVGGYIYISGVYSV